MLSVSAPDTASGSPSSDTSITFFSFITSSSEALYSFSSAWTASATVGKGLPRCVPQNLSPAKRSYVLSGILCRADTSGSEGIVTLFNCKSYRTHIAKVKQVFGILNSAHQNIVSECLVCPCVMEGRGKVDRTIQDNKQRTSEARQRGKQQQQQSAVYNNNTNNIGSEYSCNAHIPQLCHRHVVARKQAVSGVSEVVTDLLVQPLCNHLRRIPLWAADNRNGTFGNKMMVHSQYCSLHTPYGAGVRCCSQHWGRGWGVATNLPSQIPRRGRPLLCCKYPQCRYHEHRYDSVLTGGNTSR